VAKVAGDGLQVRRRQGLGECHWYRSSRSALLPVCHRSC
jgi:hypothetical protein